MSWSLVTALLLYIHSVGGLLFIFLQSPTLSYVGFIPQRLPSSIRAFFECVFLTGLLWNCSWSGGCLQPWLCTCTGTGQKAWWWSRWHNLSLQGRGIHMAVGGSPRTELEGKWRQERWICWVLTAWAVCFPAAEKMNSYDWSCSVWVT